ncbi:MAG: T9SS type A sorting domain-containing protein [Bacteroidota bacterium]
MIKIIFWFSSFFILMGSLSAQSFVGKLAPYQNLRTETQTIDTIKILGVMVEFKADQDDATFGDGKFGSIYTEDYGSDIIDPLPHDRNYFLNHFEFAANYYNKVSNGKQIVKYEILPAIITVSKTMRDYSPSVANPNDLSSIAEFCKEAWHLAGIEYPNYDFSKFNLFAILHAGVGRDVKLPGSIGNERDLPSVYLGLNSLKNLLGANFSGFPAGNTIHKIPNSMILPETESRELVGIGGKALLELSINGLIAASIASYLGLPDLFNTETGLSAIGRFGLMDGQSIFTFGGLFPPEPSPWEKIYLGWETPITVGLDDLKINLTAKNAAAISDTVILKIPINSKEYFLIENRSRDANNDGCKITYKVGSQTITRTFNKDYPSFIYYDIDTLAGVVTDVDEFDWAVPGDDRDFEFSNSFKDVGIVIWHIDENVIEQNILDNKINNDKFALGVDVVEADGIQDIGEEFQTIFGDIIIGEGTKEDTWYKSNPARFYKNRFDDNSKPNAKSNTGANSLINISNFSEVGNKMSFDLSFGRNDIKLLSRTKLQNKYNWITQIEESSEDITFLSSTASTVRINSAIDVIETYPVGSNFKPALFSFGGYDYLISVRDSAVYLNAFKNHISYSNFSNTGSLISTPPVLYESNGEHYFIIGTERGDILTYQIFPLLQLEIKVVKTVSHLGERIAHCAASNDFTAVVSETKYWDSSLLAGFVTLPFNAKQVALIKNIDGSYTSVVLLSDASFAIISDGVITSHFSIPSVDEINQFSLSPLDDTEKTFILFNSNNSIFAVNLIGTIADNFPFENNESSEYNFAPVASKVNGVVKLSSINDEGVIHLINNQAELSAGFPLTSGGFATAAPLFFSTNNSTQYCTVTNDNEFLRWQFSSSASKNIWSGDYKDSYNSSLIIAETPQTVESNYFPLSKAYNWPNPVYSGETYISFYVNEDSDAEVNIYDLAGDKVSKLKLKAVGGFDNEIPWDITNVQSGVYLAHLNVKSNSGKSAFIIIKIAVIK